MNYGHKDTVNLILVTDMAATTHVVISKAQIVTQLFRFLLGFTLYLNSFILSKRATTFIGLMSYSALVLLRRHKKRLFNIPASSHVSLPEMKY